MVPALALTIDSPWLAANSSGVATLVIPQGSNQSAPLALLTGQSSSSLTQLQLTTVFGTLPPGVNLSVVLQATTLPAGGSTVLTIIATLPPSVAVSTGMSLLVRSAEGPAIQTVARLQSASTQLELTPASVQVRPAGCGLQGSKVALPLRLDPTAPARVVCPGRLHALAVPLKLGPASPTTCHPAICTA